MIFKEFHKGIDSLYLSFKGAIKEKVLKELEEKKEFAKSEEESKQKLAGISLNGHYFEVLGKGAGNYFYILVDNWYRMQISKSTKNKTPVLYVQISSEVLNCLGLNELLKDLRMIQLEIMDLFNQEIVSRVDLFIDFLTDKDFEKIDKKEWISKADYIQSHWGKGEFTGWTIGQGGDISLRLYNKTVEIKKSKKDYFKEIWGKEGWEEGQTVWRLEFQLRRNFLKQISTDHIYDLDKTINDVWRYCTNDWVKLCIDDGLKNQTRRDTDPLWLKIQDVRFDDGSFTGVERYVDKSRIPDEMTLIKGCLGYHSSLAAMKGIKDIDTAMLDFTNNIHFFFQDYFKTKVELKMKQYNIKPKKKE